MLPSIAEAVRFDPVRGELVIAGAYVSAEHDQVLASAAEALAAVARLVCVDAVTCLGVYAVLLAWQGEGRAGIAGTLRRFQIARPGAKGAQAALEHLQGRLAQETDEQIPHSLRALAVQAAEAADRAGDRCGRRAADLLDAEDIVVVDPTSGPAASSMLREAGQVHEKAIARGSSFAHADGEPALFFLGAECVALDGAALVSRRAVEHLHEAVRRRIPRYLFAPSGPEQAVHSFGADPSADIMLVPTGLISAIVTDRGLYRPEMVARYRGDAGLPHDVIPLT